MIIERDFGKEGADFTQHGVVGLTQGRGIAQGVQVLDETPGLIELTRGFIQPDDHAIEVHLTPILVDEAVQIGLCLIESGGDVGFDTGAIEAGPADMKILSEKGLGHKVGGGGVAIIASGP